MGANYVLYGQHFRTAPGPHMPQHGAIFSTPAAALQVTLEHWKQAL